MSTAERFETDARQHPLTQEIAAWLADLKSDEITPSAYAWAKHALLDWFAVTIAGAREPLVDILAELYATGDAGVATVVARNARTSLEAAALINGAASHTLDYDDVNRRLGGHPTVPVAPVVLALGQKLGATGRDVLAALVAGTEVECMIGEMAGPGHYEHGFHSTATIGTFGAAAAAAKLLRLDQTHTRHAIGIAASQAAGLKANFGTMTKPLHAGKAAMNGMMAARLAAQGFTANDAILECARGIGDVMMPGFEAGATSPNPPGYYAIEQTLFKYHAACYLTHAGIEAIKSLRAAHKLSLNDLQAMALHINPGLFTVCCIPEPKTGLEIKFSIRHCAAMALDGADTAALDTYSDANAVDPRYVAGRGKVDLVPTEAIDRMATRVVIETKDGRRLDATYDAGTHETDLEVQGRKLASKFEALAPPIIGAQRAAELSHLIGALETASNIDKLMATAA